MARPYIPAQESASRRFDFGEAGIAVLDYLCDPSLDDAATPREEDFHALAEVDLLHGSVWWLHEPLMDASPDYGLLGRFNAKWTQFQTALPLSQGEREWLLGLEYNRECKDLSAQSLGDALSRQEGHITDAGVRRVVSGHELLHRWLAWRRETDQFKGQGTLDLARRALINLVELVAPPDMELPESAEPFK
jgi:hypothetical protein